MVKQERSARTVERLLWSAAEQVDRRGFTAASLADVSRAAGVTKGALFFHFPTKQALAEAIQARGDDVLEEVVGDLRQERDSALETLVDVTRAFNRLLREDPFVRASVRVTRERPAGEEPSVHDLYTRWLAQCCRLLDDARAGGELGRAVADASARTLVTATVLGLETLAWMGYAQTEAERWLDGVWRLLLPLLAPDTDWTAVTDSAAPDGTAPAGTADADRASPGDGGPGLPEPRASRDRS
ncbi:ScbR family autoregulator-binding transcription factor [Streptomyces sp. JJ36]|uniref:ScbR family autoregulator-binding transcription factor n=1 Tax=Streptomyces sp. JJ36 TaxID=2736645 RepID=UPI001F35439D|nr:ScbR family autoregulator-binding transcription factor [Streptomyces sp. JJ36]MCF6524517.1 TetR/AcrR family transcriptional regulator [Streptomyces sp. JJ36]